MRERAVEREEDAARTALAGEFARTVAPAESGRRIDAFLADALAGVSRARIQALIRGGHALLNGESIGAPSHKVKAGDRVTLSLPPPEPAEPAPEAIPLAVVHEDAELIVVDKPAGLVVHPAAGHHGGTLVNALIHHCGASLSGIGGVARPGIVHRLDKDTSGLIVVAKTDRAHQALAAQFAAHGRDGRLVREYRALVWGRPSPPSGTIDAAIGRSPTHRRRFAVREGGRRAVTRYEVLESFGAPESLVSLIACRLETGRTHQIRVHLARLGHPVLGDPVYGAGMRSRAARLPENARALVNDLRRQALHAVRLGFVHPVSGEALDFESPLPHDLAAIVEALRNAAEPCASR